MGFLKKIFGVDKSISNKENNDLHRQTWANMPTVNQNSGNQVQSLNLSKEEAIQSLNLRKDTIQSLCLTKPQLNGLTAKVAVVFDYSGSMESEYKHGDVQALLDRLLPIAMQFDDNGELDIWLFHNEAIRLDGIREENFYNYINNSKILKKYRMYGTEYAPVMKDVVKKYVKEEPSNYPTLVIFITDGDCQDCREAKQMMKLSAQYPIFWQFIGLSKRNTEFTFLKSLDNMDGRIIDNANFFEVKDPKQMSDNELYNKILGEYPDWISKAQKQGILK